MNRPLPWCRECHILKSLPKPRLTGNYRSTLQSNAVPLQGRMVHWIFGQTNPVLGRSYTIHIIPNESISRDHKNELANLGALSIRCVQRHQQQTHEWENQKCVLLIQYWFSIFTYSGFLLAGITGGSASFSWQNGCFIRWNVGENKK